jgi:anti-sigma factor (TIGR02949 family)
MPNDIPDIDCDTALRQLWDYLDHELTDDRMAMVRQHVAKCAHCLPHHDYGRRFLEALHTTRDERLMPPELRTQVLSLLEQEGLSMPAES